MNRYRFHKVPAFDQKIVTIQADYDPVPENEGGTGKRVARIGIEQGATDTGILMLDEDAMRELGFALVAFSDGRDVNEVTSRPRRPAAEPGLRFPPRSKNHLRVLPRDQDEQFDE